MKKFAHGNAENGCAKTNGRRACAVASNGNSLALAKRNEHERTCSGSGRKLTLADECWLRYPIVDECPQQLKLPFAFWTRPAVKALIRERFGVERQDRWAGKYLKRWGFTPKRPIKHVLEQAPIQVVFWLEQTYPALLARAKAEGAAILWGDETAVKEDAHWVRGYAPKGQTPVLKTPTHWDKLSMISDLSVRGELAFQIVEGSINTVRFLEFLARLIEGATRKLYRDFKTALRSGPISHSSAELLEKTQSFMSRIAMLPNHEAAYFKHPSAAYAAQGIEGPGL